MYRNALRDPEISVVAPQGEDFRSLGDGSKRLSVATLSARTKVLRTLRGGLTFLVLGLVVAKVSLIMAWGEDRYGDLLRRLESDNAAGKVLAMTLLPGPLTMHLVEAFQSDLAPAQPVATFRKD